MKRQNTILQVEEMESRVVPSVVETMPLGSAPVASAAVQGQQQSTEHILGTVEGTYSVLAAIGVDTGILFSFHGHGQFHFLGPVDLTGSIQGSGFIRSGEAKGDITLTNGRGSVTFQLTGPSAEAFAGLPDQFHFTVLKATGAYKGLEMSGSVDLAHDAAKHGFKMTFETTKSIHDANALAGKVSGSSTVQPFISVEGLKTDLSGSGDVGLLGDVKVTGWVQATGVVSTGHATGELTLSNGSGSVTLELTGPKQTGMAALPDVFQFSVLSATGTYKGLKETGSIDLKIDPIEWMTPNGNPKLPIIWGQGGSFQLTITPKAA